MKNIYLFLALFTTILLTSCTGDRGPAGEDGGVYLGQVFEKTVNFEYFVGPNILETPFVSYPVTVYESDAILVYRYEGTVEGKKVWTQLPQSIFYYSEDGTSDIFQFNFNYTYVDIQFTIEGNFELSTIGPAYTDNQKFRVAVVPSEYANADLSMEDLMYIMNVDESSVQEIE